MMEEAVRWAWVAPQGAGMAPQGAVVSERERKGWAWVPLGAGTGSAGWATVQQKE